ncbi:MAG: hypothetical protein WDZ63_17025 [Burkholderiales bacterium]
MTFEPMQFVTAMQQPAQTSVGGRPPASARAHASGDHPAGAFVRALDHFLRATGHPLAEVEDILRTHPHFVPAHLLRLAIVVCAKDAAAAPRLAAALTDAERAAAHAGERDNRHIAAARAWLAGKPLIAAEFYVSALREDAHDVLALRLAQSCYFFLGYRSALRRTVDKILPAWTRNLQGYEHVLAISGFAYGETGDPWRAEALCLEALDIQPIFPFAIHAMAHVLHERGEHRRGIDWMRQREPQWNTGGRMTGHNAWHLAMFDLSCGNRNSALEILDATLLPLAEESASNAADATALLWQLQLDGASPGSRWSRLSECWSKQLVPGFSPFLDLHAAIAFNAARHPDRENALARTIESTARGSSYSEQAARNVTLRGMPAIGAFATGAYRNASEMLRAFAPAREKLGASHAQEGLFERMSREAERHLAPGLSRDGVLKVA